MKRYILVGGKARRALYGVQFTGLTILGSADTYEEARALTDKSYEPSSGLLLWIDLTTGEPGEPSGPTSLSF